MEDKNQILEEILAWSTDQPMWQRDVLRRLVENDSIDQEDFNELVLICRQSHEGDLDVGQMIKATPLEADHIPSSIPGVKKVYIDYISDVKNVNALAPEQKLKFGGRKNGLTIIYGDNASGKSGYGRIIKRACRSRNRGNPIKSNIYKDSPGQSPAANLHILVDEQPKNVLWQEGQTAPAELSYVSFFDSECALTHIGESNDIAFTPFGLDLFEKLAQIAIKINRELLEKKQDLEGQQPEVLKNPKIHTDSEVATILKNIKHSSSFDELKTALCLSDDNKEELKQLRADFDQDPRIQIEGLKKKKRDLERISSLLSLAEEYISDGKILAYKGIRKNFL